MEDIERPAGDKDFNDAMYYITASPPLPATNLITPIEDDTDLYQNSLTHIYNKINNREIYNLPNAFDYIQYKPGYHLFTYEDVYGIRVNK
jgi:hypothetical protein